MKRNAWFALALVAAAGCGGSPAGRAAEADGPRPSGKGPRRALVLVEEPPPAKPPPSKSGDGTTTKEIVESVERDRP
jgi:hypothetical protein